jgi:membrane protease YdiL (CAAX protease family)
MKNTTDPFPWRVFWLLLAAGVVGTSASLPYLSGQFFANPVVRKAMPPISLPVFELLVVAQSAVYLALIIPLGLLLARRIGFEFPLVRAWASGERAPAAGRVLAVGLLSGVAVGVLVLALEIVVFFPHLPPPLQALDAGSVSLWKRLLLGLFYGGIVEELFSRLFLLSLFVWLLGFVFRSADGRPSAAVFWTANLLAALLFALGHLPGTSTVAPLTALLVTRALALNGLVGMACGYLYWRRGLEAAMFAHMGFHLVWQLPGAWIARALLSPVSGSFL